MRHITRGYLKTLFVVISVLLLMTFIASSLAAAGYKTKPNWTQGTPTSYSGYKKTAKDQYPSVSSSPEILILGSQDEANTNGGWVFWHFINNKGDNTPIDITFQDSSGNQITVYRVIGYKGGQHYGVVTPAGWKIVTAYYIDHNESGSSRNFNISHWEPIAPQDVGIIDSAKLTIIKDFDDQSPLDGGPYIIRLTSVDGGYYIDFELSAGNVYSVTADVRAAQYGRYYVDELTDDPEHPFVEFTQSGATLDSTSGRYIIELPSNGDVLLYAVNEGHFDLPTDSNIVTVQKRLDDGVTLPSSGTFTVKLTSIANSPTDDVEFIVTAPFYSASKVVKEGEYIVSEDPVTDYSIIGFTGGDELVHDLTNNEYLLTVYPYDTGVIPYISIVANNEYEGSDTHTENIVAMILLKKHISGSVPDTDVGTFTLEMVNDDPRYDSYTEVLSYDNDYSLAFIAEPGTYTLSETNSGSYSFASIFLGGRQYSNGVKLNIDDEGIMTVFSENNRIVDADEFDVIQIIVNNRARTTNTDPEPEDTTKQEDKKDEEKVVEEEEEEDDDDDDDDVITRESDTDTDSDSDGDADTDDDDDLPVIEPGHTLVREGDRYIELDMDGVPLGEWVYDEDLEDWVFEEYPPPLGNLPPTSDNTKANPFLLLGIALASAGCGFTWLKYRWVIESFSRKN